MSTVDTISGLLDTYGANSSTATTESSDLNKDAFLQLLVTQMQYQDPLEPAKNEDFLAQMAQFSALEQMNNLNTSFSMQQANSMLGKQVIALSVNAVTGASEYIQGTVDAVNMSSGTVTLAVGDYDIELDNVQSVLPDTTDYSAITEAIAAINETLTSVNEKLENLQALVEDEETTVSDEVTASE